MKVALFGDSYIVRIGRFCNFSLEVPAEVRFFGRGGMTISNYDSDLVRQLIEYQPEVAILNIGGNDINSLSKPRNIVEKIKELVSDLKIRGIRVYVCEIVERGRFPKDKNLTQECFTAQRNRINLLLKKYVDIIKLNMRYPKDYDLDLVHFSEIEGQRRFFFIIRRFITSLK